MSKRPLKRTARSEFANERENSFAKLAGEMGFEFSKRGWPDFFCRDDKGFFAVEVKKRRDDGSFVGLTYWQIQALTALSRAGIRCFLSDGECVEPFNAADYRDRL